MPSSYELVNYSLRPAKAAERKMLCEIVRRLEPFSRIAAYRYVGFGSIYFADFNLFHQNLGISDMVSIEKDEANEDRFRFNRPFRCVNLVIGHSNTVLPTIAWDKRCFLWLDYDSKLNKSVLADIATVVSKVASGSLLVVTVNVQPERMPGAGPSKQDEYRLESLSGAVGYEKVPLGTTGASLRSVALAKVCRKIMLNEIAKALTDRNGPLEDGSKLRFQQVVHFLYADGAQMLTVGGVLYENREESLAQACGFHELSFVAKGEDAFTIRAPKLTQKEIRHVNSQLPRVPPDQLSLPGVPDSDVQDYAAIYRYYPSFSEVLLG
jgi:hypothetical protein